MRPVTRAILAVAAHVLVGCTAETPAPGPESTITPPAETPKPTSCTTLTAPPTDRAAISTFVTESAVPLRNGSGWNVAPLVELFAEKRLFMMGEVHGQNEIGIVSAVVFEALAAKKLVNVVGLEVPMDLTPDFQRYVDTGKDPTVAKVANEAPNTFLVTLLKAARALTEKGIAIRVAGIDVPEDPQFAATEIKGVAAKLTTQRATVLDTLPTSSSSTADVDAWFASVNAKKTSVCSELSRADCDRLFAMSNALWCAVHSRTKNDLFYARREEVFYSNIATAISSDARLYLHMGAEHTMKHGEVVSGHAAAGARLASENEATRGKVVAIGPAWSPGSTIFYAGSETDADTFESPVANAYSAPPAEPVFVSTSRPSARCETNPIGGEDFDGYIHYGKLTPENRPDATPLTR